jgi:hypothetical protein
MVAGGSTGLFECAHCRFRSAFFPEKTKTNLFKKGLNQNQGKTNFLKKSLNKNSNKENGRDKKQTRNEK